MGAEFDRNIQNWAKAFGMGPHKKHFTLLGFQLTRILRAYYKLVCFQFYFRKKSIFRA